MRNRMMAPLAALLVGSMLLAVPGPVRGAVEPEIPGTPFTGTTTSGVVGGEIFDFVYSLSVEAGTVLLASVRGEAGAELGLYIFGVEATSIITSEPLAISAKPGADQTVSIQFFRGTTIYLNVNGRNTDRPYAFQLIVSRVIDRTPPIFVSPQAPKVARALSVCVRFDAVDQISGVQSVAVYETGLRDEIDWQPYVGAGSYCQELGVDEGERLISIAAENSIGLTTHLNLGLVMIDNTPPVVRLGSPPAGVLLKPRGQITWRASEVIRTTGKRKDTVVVTTQGGVAIPGTTTLSADKKTIAWRPIDAVAAGTLFVATLGGITDRAGNLSPFIEPHVVVRKSATKLSLSVASASSKRAQLLVAASSNLVGETIQLQVRLGRVWTNVKSVQLSGRSTPVAIGLRGAREVRAVWAGSELLGGSASPARVVAP